MFEISLTVVAAAVLLTIGLAAGADADQLPALDAYTLYETEVVSSIDAAAQPVVVGHPEALSPGELQGEPLPLLVAVHSWSTNRHSSTRQQAHLAAERGWLAVFPEFRGPNLVSNPHVTQAGASLYAQRDVIDAVEYMKAHFPVEPRRIYLMGGSGGGHMSLMMACKYPDLWAAVSSWCPITCMRQWWEQGNNYAPHIEAVCGGKPGDSPQVDFEYLRRAPRSFITNAATIPVSIHHGQMDATIHYQQSVQTFSLLAEMPGHRVSFASDSTGHHADYARGASWLEQQVRAERPPERQVLVTDEPKWYFWCYLEPAEKLTLSRAEAGLVGLDRELTLMVSAQSAAEVRIDLRALGVELTKADGGAEGRVEQGILVLRPQTAGADISYSRPVVRVR